MRSLLITGMAFLFTLGGFSTSFAENSILITEIDPGAMIQIIGPETTPRVEMKLVDGNNLEITYCNDNNLCEQVGENYSLEDYQNAVRIPLTMGESNHAGGLIGGALGAALPIACILRAAACVKITDKYISRNMLAVFAIYGSVPTGVAAGSGIDYLLLGTKVAYDQRDLDNSLSQLRDSKRTNLHVRSIEEFLSHISELQIKITNAKNN